MKYYFYFIISFRILGIISIIPTILMFLLHIRLTFIYNNSIFNEIGAKSISKMIRNIATLEFFFIIITFLSGCFNNINRFFTDCCPVETFSTIFFNLLYFSMISLPFQGFSEYNCLNIENNLNLLINNNNSLKFSKLFNLLEWSELNECLNLTNSFVNNICRDSFKKHNKFVALLIFCQICNYIIYYYFKNQIKIDLCEHIKPIGEIPKPKNKFPIVVNKKK